MALNLIIGKPGSGKSYYAVSRLSEYILDFARKEKRTGKMHNREIYTNLVLNYEEIQKFVNREVGQGVEVEKYFHFLDQEFFSATSEETGFWWDNFPEGALIVIDEVHEYVPAKGIGSKNGLEVFTVYISQHRHKGQDLFFITQHTDTIHKNILCMAEGAYHIVNVKSRVIPWLGIPFSDIDVVKEAFGIKSQVANIIFGNYLGKSFKRESTSTFVLRPEIFALYNSHMRGSVQSDRPSLDLSPLGAIIWFLRRHLMQLTFKAILVVGVCYSVYYVLASAPEELSKNLSKNLVKPTEKPIKTPSPPPMSGGNPRYNSEISGGASRAVPSSFPDLLNTKIYVYCQDYVVTDSGKKKIGDVIKKDGKDEKIIAVDYVSLSVDTERMPDVVADSVESGLDELSVSEDGGDGNKIDGGETKN
ncbi:MAG: zonular occludens toxin domain-containing protein [Planctomycetia bacterium]|nr:zonular occludens toxin domain-containing protein [Planctomycetia bacterium]